MKDQDINKMKYEEYENIEIVQNYKNDIAQIGLWESEKIIFKKYLEKEDKILDIACGAGRTTFSLNRLGFENIIGLDYSHQMIKTCKEISLEYKSNIEFILGDACDLPFSDNSFDKCIFAFSGLMTIPTRENRRKALLEVNRVLKKNGLLIFTTHDKESIKFRKFWKDEEIKWRENKQDNRLVEYGDIIYNIKTNENEIEGFVHIPDKEEILTELNLTNFEIIFSSKRNRICEEPKHVLERSADCVF